MRRAAQVFDVDEDGSDCALVEKVWTARSTPESEFQAVAETHWQFVVTTQFGRTGVFLQGANDVARVTPVPEEAEFFGVVLRLGCFMPSVSLSRLAGGGIVLPGSDRSFWLAGTQWEIPTPGNADVMVERMKRDGLLVEDRFVARALRRQEPSVSLRTMQRRVRRATGMTQSVLRQIERAYDAADALGRGASVSEVALAFGFSDQPHLTRSLRRFIGQTPAQVRGTGGLWSASTPLGRLASMNTSVSLPFNTGAPEGS